MNLKSGEQFTLDTDPLLALIAAECETVEDEFELEAIRDERESILLAAQAYTAIRNSSNQPF